MFRKAVILAIISSVISTAAFAGIFHHKKKNNNPLADVNSKQPDKVLYDRAMDAMKHGKFDVARITLQTLINTYPDSEYIARAKLSVGDAWYNEGGSTALAQAEIEYKDFITFFPNMPEAAEAQLKVANIHYRQMGKADRDFTHARRAEDEYRTLIEQFPDSKLVPQAQQRLREVQEVLADREFRIGKFYAMKEAYPAAIARLTTLSETYPLYSGADEALFLLGNAYEHEADLIRRVPTTGPRHMTELAKGKLVQLYTNQAAEAYAKIVTRYPAMERVDDAKQRLHALGKPVPTPTPQAIAQSKAEEASRSETGKFGRIMGNFKHGPDVAEASKVGEPTMTDPHETSAVDLIRSADETVRTGGATGPNTVTAETVGRGPVPESQPVPRSDAASTDNTGGGSDSAAPAAGGSDNSATPAASSSGPDSSRATSSGAAGSTDSGGSTASSNPADTSSSVESTSTNAGSSGNDSIPELAPTTSPTPATSSSAAGTTSTGAAATSSPANSSTAQPNSTSANGTAPLPAPPQVNEVDQNDQSQAQNANSTDNNANGTSTSKKKKKKGLKKLIPF